MQKDKQIHLRVTNKEKQKIEKNAQVAGFKQTSEYVRHKALEEKELHKPFKFETVMQPCKTFLFLVEPLSGELNSQTLTTLIRSINILSHEDDKNLAEIEFIMDEDDICMKFFKNKVDFKISWLTRKGEIVNSYPIKHYTVKNRFPTFFSHSEVNVAIGKVIIEFDHPSIIEF